MIQPYIGLQRGLAAIQQTLAGSGASVTEDLARLLVLTNEGITDLQHYMGALQDKSTPEGSWLPSGLLPALQRFAGKCAEATGIAVPVETETALFINDRLVADVFQTLCRKFWCVGAVRRVRRCQESPYAARA